MNCVSFDVIAESLCVSALSSLARDVQWRMSLQKIAALCDCLVDPSEPKFGFNAHAYTFKWRAFCQLPPMIFVHFETFG
jgi:hypothetical protein